MGIRFWLVFLVFVSASRLAYSDESKVPLGDVPKAGVEAVKAMFPGAEIQGAARETEDDKTVFEITLKQKGKNIDVTVGTDGKIQLVEKEIAQSDLPAAVRKALADKYPQAKFKIIEEVSNIKDGKAVLDFYEAGLTTAAKQSLEVQIAPDGTVKKEEKKSGGID